MRGGAGTPCFVLPVSRTAPLPITPSLITLSHCPLTDVMAAAAPQVQRVTPATTTTTTTSQVEKAYENAGGAGTYPRRGA
jgi:hypothetical protein